MKFETLKKDNRKKWLVGACGILAILGTIAFVGTKAKYMNTQRIDLVDGTINWKPYDLNIVAIKLQNESGTYDNSNTVPTSGYSLSDKSYCEVNGTKDSSIPMEYKEGKVYIGITKKDTKCYLYFDKEIKASETILAGKTIDESRSNGSFTEAFVTNTTGKIYKGQDDDGDTYFFAGAVDNNWIQFGGFYWRIIRINGDGTIRMIYSGAANGDVSDANKTGTTTQINETTYPFNASSNDNAYVGYMYGQVGTSNYADTHKNTNSSTIKTEIDTWYNTNLNKDGIKEHIDTNAGFCGDREVIKGEIFYTEYYGDGYGTIFSAYAPSSRIANGDGWLSTQTPTFKCKQKNDYYTTNNANKGNKALTHPVGLITMDEAIYAGGFGGTKKSEYYLYTAQDYWTISPHGLSSTSSYAGDASMVVIRSNTGFGFTFVSTTRGIRPVINLRADTKLTGTGTTTDPFRAV